MCSPAIASAGAAPLDMVPITDPTSVESVEAKILAFRLGHAAGLGRVEDYRITPNMPKPGCKIVLGKIQRFTDSLRGIFSFTSIIRPASGARISRPVLHDEPEATKKTLQILPFISFGRTSSLDPVLYHDANVHDRHNGPFIARLERAIMSLGPWEARAVAFVLGCGFGALLRTLFMLCLITMRAFRSRSQRHVELSEDVAVFLPVDEAIPSSDPPAYGDEKVTLREMIADDPTASPFSEEDVRIVETVGMNAISNGLSVYWTR